MDPSSPLTPGKTLSLLRHKTGPSRFYRKIILHASFRNNEKVIVSKL